MKYAMLALGMLLLPLAAMAEPTVVDNPEDTEPLKAGDEVPDVTVKNLEGEDVSLREFVDGNPTALIFYRGGWCPFCNRHLSAMGRKQDELKELGYQIAAISPDSPENLKEQAEKRKLDYALLSDSSLEASTAFGLAFRLAPDHVERYKNEYNIDLGEWSGGQNQDVLPVPALYLINGEGEIVWAYTNPDYKERANMDDILEAAAGDE